MGQCFLYGTGGGGSGVRVVIKAEAPTNPRENTVWVKSDTSGKKYVFAEAEPEAAEEGMLWLSVTGKGIITAAKVYSGGKWVLVDACMFIGGQWVPIASSWDGTLFYNGNQYTDVTGGWTGANSYSPDLRATIYDGTITISTASAVDLSGFSTLKFMGSGNGANSGGKYPAYCKIVNESGVKVASVDFQSNGTYAVSVVALSGKHYVQFVADGSRGNNLDISKVWLE